MMEQIYIEQLENQKTDLEIMKVGVVAKASKLILDNVRVASDDKLTLKDVCDFADELNAMLHALDRKQIGIAATEKEIENEKAKKAKESGDE